MEALVSASGSEIRLKFTQNMWNIGVSSQLPAESSFTVRADGEQVTVQLVTVALSPDFDTLILELSAAAISAGQVVTVSYVLPACCTNPILEDVDGDDAAPFTDFPVVNNSTVDRTPPELASAEVHGNRRFRLILTFNEDLDFSNGNTPRASAFTVKADGAVVTLESISLGSGSSSNKFTLSLPDDAIGQGQFVTVSYALLDSRNLRDLNGDYALPFTDRPVTNNSTVANTTPPFLASAEVEADGRTLVLTFNEALDISADYPAPPVGAFTVKADGVVVTVQSMALDVNANKQLRLLLSTAIQEVQPVTVSYAVPADDDSPLQDVDGNPVNAFPDREVINELHRGHDPAGAGERGGTDIGRQSHPHLRRRPRHPGRTSSLWSTLSSSRSTTSR